MKLTDIINKLDNLNEDGPVDMDKSFVKGDKVLVCDYGSAIGEPAVVIQNVPESDTILVKFAQDGHTQRTLKQYVFWPDLNDTNYVRTKTSSSAKIVDEDFGSSDWTPVMRHMNSMIGDNNNDDQLVWDAAIECAENWHDMMGYDNINDAARRIVHMYHLRNDNKPVSESEGSAEKSKNMKDVQDVLYKHGYRYRSANTGFGGLNYRHKSDKDKTIKVIGAGTKDHDKLYPTWKSWHKGAQGTGSKPLDDHLTALSRLKVSEGSHPDIPGSDDYCDACSQEVANHDCGHGILCDTCYADIHGDLDADCDLNEDSTPTNYNPTMDQQEDLDEDDDFEDEVDNGDHPNMLQIGDKVKIDAPYGGGVGYVNDVSPSGLFYYVEKNGDVESYHGSDLIKIEDDDDINDEEDLDENGQSVELNHGGKIDGAFSFDESVNQVSESGKRPKVTARKYEGDDMYSWAVFRSDKSTPMYTGLGKGELEHYKKLVNKIIDKEFPINECEGANMATGQSLDPYADSINVTDVYDSTNNSKSMTVSARGAKAAELKDILRLSGLIPAEVDRTPKSAVIVADEVATEDIPGEYSAIRDPKLQESAPSNQEEYIYNQLKSLAYNYSANEEDQEGISDIISMMQRKDYEGAYNYIHEREWHSDNVRSKLLSSIQALYDMNDELDESPEDDIAYLKKMYNAPDTRSELKPIEKNDDSDNDKEMEYISQLVDLLDDEENYQDSDKLEEIITAIHNDEFTYARSFIFSEWYHDDLRDHVNSILQNIMNHKNVTEAWANEPNEQTLSAHLQLIDMADGLAKPVNMINKYNKGDNAMTVKKNKEKEKKVDEGVSTLANKLMNKYKSSLAESADPTAQIEKLEKKKVKLKKEADECAKGHCYHEASAIDDDIKEINKKIKELKSKKKVSESDEWDEPINHKQDEEDKKILHVACPRLDCKAPSGKKCRRKSVNDNSTYSVAPIHSHAERIRDSKKLVKEDKPTIMTIPRKCDDCKKKKATETEGGRKLCSYCAEMARDRTKNKVAEAWDTKMKTPASKKGMFKGRTLASMKSELNKLKKKEKKTAADKTKEKELMFAIRAKQKDKWGSIKESIDTSFNEAKDCDDCGAQIGGPHEYFCPRRGEDDQENWQSGDYVRDASQFHAKTEGEIFKVRGNPDERRVRIEDSDGRGWYISPLRLVKVNDDDPQIQQYFPEGVISNSDEDGFEAAELDEDEIQWPEEMNDEQLSGIDEFGNDVNDNEHYGDDELDESDHDPDNCHLCGRPGCSGEMGDCKAWDEENDNDDDDDFSANDSLDTDFHDHEMDIDEELDEEGPSIVHKNLRSGDKVKILGALGSFSMKDTFGKKGQIGTIVARESNETFLVKFDDGSKHEFSINQIKYVPPMAGV